VFWQVASLSKTSGIPAFFVAFIITPFASNASEVPMNHAVGTRWHLNCSETGAHWHSWLVTSIRGEHLQLVSSINFAKKKKQKNISLTYSQVFLSAT
jgi:hypothetical protein